MGNAKSEVARGIYDQAEPLVGLARAIHRDPEIAFSEHRASARLVDLLSDSGFEIRTAVAGLPTAFVASRGTGERHVALCAEYDALDGGIGHGSGRHLVAGAAIGAAIGLAPLVDDRGLTVSVLGTPGADLLNLHSPPADHVRPGKAALLEGGAFAGARAVLMLVPSASFTGFAVSRAQVRSRASLRKIAPRSAPDVDQARLRSDLLRAAAPWGAGSISCRFRRSAQADEISADIGLSASTLRQAMHAADAVRLLFEAAAAAGGMTLRVTRYEPTRELRQDPFLRRAFLMNAAALGIVREPFTPRPTFTTDIGVVSTRVPVIAPMIALGGTAQIGTRDFAALSDTDHAYRAMLHGAVALARTALDVRGG